MEPQATSLQPAASAAGGAVATKETIAENLRRQIVQFALLPGELLSENTLAATLGVSRAPVRDALSRLAGQGCVIVFPQRGTQVSHISMERIQQAIFLRTTLEQSVLEEVCATGLSPAQLAQVEDSIRLQRQLLEAQADAALLDEDTRMHWLLYEFCGHQAAWAAIHNINCDLMRIRWLQIRTFSYKTSMSAVDSWENSLTEHRMMLDALRKRDTEAVCLLSNRHINQIALVSETLRRIYPQYFSAYNEEE